jgi:hypothetical protein
VQHDGDIWRCLVARPVAVNFESDFPAGSAIVIRWPAPPEPAPAMIALKFVPSSNAWPHEPDAGTSGAPPSHSIIALLAQSLLQRMTTLFVSNSK